MAGLLSLIAGLGRAGLAADTGRMEGAGVKRDREQKDLLAQLARDRQAQQDAADARMQGLQERNLLDLIRERNEPTPEQFPGQPIEARGPEGPGYYMRGNLGTVRRVPGIEPLAEPKQEERKEGDGVALYENGNFVGWKIAPSKPESDRTTAATAVRLAEGKGQLDAIQQARKAVQAYPEAVGLKRGISLLPGMGKLGSVVNQHTDPRGIEARQHLGNVGSLKIRDRSGAAVTISEFPRLAPFIPQEYDSYEKVMLNLDAMERELKIVLDALANGASIADLMGGKPTSTPVQTPPAGTVDVNRFLPPRRP